MKLRNIFFISVVFSVVLSITSCGKKDVSFASMSDKELEKILVGEWVCTGNKGTEDEQSFVLNFEKKGKLSIKMFYNDEENLVYENFSGTWECVRKDVSPYAEKIAAECGITWIKDKFPYIKIKDKNDTRKNEEFEEGSLFLVDNGKKGKDYKIMLCVMDFDMDEYVFDQKNPESKDAEKLSHYFYYFENLCDENNAFFKEKFNSKGAKEISSERLDEIDLNDAAIRYSRIWTDEFYYRSWGKYEDWELSNDKTFVHIVAEYSDRYSESGTWEIKKQTFSDELGEFYITFYLDNEPYKCFIFDKSESVANLINPQYVTSEGIDINYLGKKSFKILKGLK